MSVARRVYLGEARVVIVAARLGILNRELFDRIKICRIVALHGIVPKMIWLFVTGAGMSMPVVRFLWSN